MSPAQTPAPILALDAGDWSGPFPTGAAAALETGTVILLPNLAFELTGAETVLLSAEALDDTRKNISLDPATGAVQGTGADEAARATMAAMLGRYAAQAQALVQAIAPGYAPHLERARTSYRPAEIAFRTPASPRKDDKRLHIDAFPTRPTHGGRILRVFSNIARDGTARQWRLGEPFADLAQKFLPRLGTGWPGQAAALAAFGLTKRRRSRYDFMMLSLHDRMKLDGAYQAATPGTPLILAPGTTWLCFTDAVSHAAMAGRFALEQTFHLPVEAMAAPEAAPLRVLERMTGRRLA